LQNKSDAPYHDESPVARLKSEVLSNGLHAIEGGEKRNICPKLFRLSLGRRIGLGVGTKGEVEKSTHVAGWNKSSNDDCTTKEIHQRDGGAATMYVDKKRKKKKNLNEKTAVVIEA
jgi:hypothetical protein